MVFDLLNRPVLTLAEAIMVMGVSGSTIKRRIEEGRLKVVERDNLRHKILIKTDSVKRYLNIEGGAGNE